MAIIRNVEIFWVKCDPKNPSRYEGKGPAKWTVQFRVKDKDTKKQLEDLYGFKFSPIEDDVSGKLVYKTTISRYAFRADPSGKENVNDPNKPVSVVLGDLSPVDPNTVGNGSIGHISFSFKDDKSSRTLKGIQLIKMKVFEGGSDEEFEATDDFEIIGGTTEEDF